MVTITQKSRQFIAVKLLCTVFTIWLAASNIALAAEDRIELEKIDIQGASELPKVLYIVPWKRAEIDNSPVEVDSMIDEVMMPIDREVLRRKIDYFEKGVFGE